MYFFVKNTNDTKSSNSTIHNLNDELTVPDPKLGLVATYARDGHGYRKEDDAGELDTCPKDEETGFEGADLVDDSQDPPSLWTSLAQLARLTTQTESPAIALEIGYPNVEDNKGYKLNLGLVKVALYAKSAKKPVSRGISKSRDSSPGFKSRDKSPEANRWVVRMPQPVDATRLRVYPDGQVTGNYEYAVNAFGLKIGVGMYRSVNAHRYRIDRFGVRRSST
ncbi:hypothetical protein CJU89_6358 [Yarrowia sp. B02]|nr:hypothetical protein CJU89_6358 [Yarrowia sp. B02]